MSKFNLKASRSLIKKSAIISVSELDYRLIKADDSCMHSMAERLAPLTTIFNH
jgi:hypothetical protein